MRYLAWLSIAFIATSCLVENPFHKRWSTVVTEYHFPHVDEIDAYDGFAQVDTSDADVEGEGASLNEEEGSLHFVADSVQTLVIPLRNVPENAIGIAFQLRGEDGQVVFAVLRHEDGEAGLGIRLTDEFQTYPFEWSDFEGDSFTPNELEALAFQVSGGGELWLDNIMFILAPEETGEGGAGGAPATGGREAEAGTAGALTIGGYAGEGGERATGGRRQVGGFAGLPLGPSGGDGSFGGDGALGGGGAPFQGGGALGGGGPRPAGGAAATGGSNAIPCADGAYDHDGNPSTVCRDWTNCNPGEYVTQEGTATADRICASCPERQTTHADNQTVCVGHGLALGNDHSCAIALSTLTVTCWGSDDYGQLGNDEPRAASSAPVVVSGVNGATQLAACGDDANGMHVCARVADGRVACWGWNGSNQLGDSVSATYSATPVFVQELSNVVEVAAGGSHTCALGAAGTVHCWGLDADGALGNGEPRENSSEPVAVSMLTDVVQIAAGGRHTCARLRRGTVWCWGSDSVGQLGNDVPFADSSTPVQVSGLTGAEEISAGRTHTCARHGSGVVHCWGADTEGQLGNGLPLENSPIPVPVQGLAAAVEIALGSRHACARLATGAMHCWGLDFYGQLGDGPPLENSPTPSPVSGLSDVIEIGAGAFHTCARLSTGAVSCWGRDNSGQLGDGEPLENSPIPLPVLLPP